MPDAALDWQSSWRSNSSPFGVAVRSFPNFFVPPESLGALKQSIAFFSRLQSIDHVLRWRRGLTLV